MDYSNRTQPVYSAEVILPELTFKVFCIAILLTIMLAVANCFLALKVGLLTSASIPAAVLAMGVLGLFKNSNILEINLIQTCASAGEAIAGGVVYTIPALIIIHYWQHFNYYQTMAIAMIGSLFGIAFSIPIRKMLVTDHALAFPEGQAIAEVLKAQNSTTSGVRALVFGGMIGGLVELAQSGLKLIASQIQFWYFRHNFFYGFGFGFSAMMVGAGYLIGARTGVSIFIGAVLGWYIGIPTISSFCQLSPTLHPIDTVMDFWNHQLRYVGIGAMLVAAMWLITTLFKPFIKSMRTSMQLFNQRQISTPIRTEYDIPLPYVILGIILLAIWTLIIFQQVFDLGALKLPLSLVPFLIAITLSYILIFGFLFCVICGYFSGMVGVSASPGSAVIIAGMLLSAMILRFCLKFSSGVEGVQLQEAAAITIFIGALITGSAAIANDNIQDLKVGHLLGATPWKQQVMLMIGAIVSSLLIPLVMELLYNVYGIADSFPRAQMSHAEPLPAPPAALLGTIAQGVFHDNLPWKMLSLGASCMCVIILFAQYLRRFNLRLSVLGIAIGMYLPISSSTPLFFGSLVAYFAQKRFSSQEILSEKNKTELHNGMLKACGLVAGAALMEVFIAMPFAIAHNPNILTIMPKNWLWLANILGPTTLFGLGIWLYTGNVYEIHD